MSETPGLLVDFRSFDALEWYRVNDAVMGGISRGGIQPTDSGTALFAGELSLENNGGFASVRSPVGAHDLSKAAGLEIRVRGDGRSYQLRLHTDDRFDGIAYRAGFETTRGEWTTVRIPFDKFLPTFRGRVPYGAPPLDTARIRQIGLMLADKRPGPFALEIEWIRSWESTNPETAPPR